MREADRDQAAATSGPQGTCRHIIKRRRADKSVNRRQGQASWDIPFSVASTSLEGRDQGRGYDQSRSPGRLGHIVTGLTQILPVRITVWSTEVRSTETVPLQGVCPSQPKGGGLTGIRLGLKAYYFYSSTVPTHSAKVPYVRTYRTSTTAHSPGLDRLLSRLTRANLRRCRINLLLLAGIVRRGRR